MLYDDKNIFAKILRHEIPCDFMYEDDYAVAFRDMNPQANVHALVISKDTHISFDDFVQNAAPKVMLGFFRAVQNVAECLNVQHAGYRLITNHGSDGGQVVPHFHVHLLAGENIGPLCTKYG